MYALSAINFDNSGITLLSLFISAYNQTDTFILGFVDPKKSEVGSYSVGVKSIDVIIGFITSLSTVFIPQSAYYWQKEDKTQFNKLTKYSMNIALFIVLPAVATIIILATPITKLISGNYINEGFKNSTMVLMCISSMMITYSLSDIIYNQILLPQGKENHYLFALISGTVLNVALSIVMALTLFKDRPSVGVSIATAVTDLLVLIYLFIDSLKFTKKALFNANSLKLLIATALIVGSSIGLNIAFTNAFKNMTSANMYLLDLVLTILIDAVIYIGSLLIMKEDLVSSFVKKKTTSKAMSE